MAFINFYIILLFKTLLIEFGILQNKVVYKMIITCLFFYLLKFIGQSDLDVLTSCGFRYE